MSRLDFLRKKRLGRLFDGAWTPQSLPNLLGHYDASVEPSVPQASTGNSPLIPTMTDLQGLSVNGLGPINFTQSVAANQPVMISGQSPSCLQAYCPTTAVRFNGFMAATLGFSFLAGDSWTVFMTGNPGAIFSPEPFLYGGGGAHGMDFNLGGLAYKAGGTTYVLGAAVGGWQRQVWSFDGTNGLITVTRNEGSLGAVAWVPEAFAPAVIWRNGNAGAAFGVTRIGEWGIYKGLLDSNAQAVLGAQQKAKWFTLCV